MVRSDPSTIRKENHVTESWTPRDSDIHWLENLVRVMNDKGTWGVPMNGAIYQVFKKEKVLALVDGPKDDIYDKNAVILKTFGYTIEDRRSSKS